MHAPCPQVIESLARHLREQERSLRFIGQRLEAAGLTPRCGGRWHPSTVAALLASETTSDIRACRRRAKQLREEQPAGGVGKRYSCQLTAPADRPALLELTGQLFWKPQTYRSSYESHMRTPPPRLLSYESGIVENAPASSSYESHMRTPPPRLLSYESAVVRKARQLVI